MKWAIKQSSAPTDWPVTVDEVKAHCRIDTDEDDALLLRLIKSATMLTEALCWSALIQQTWVLSANEFPCTDELVLPKGPLLAVDSVTYDDESGTPHTLTVNTDYVVDNSSEPGKICLTHDSVWPITRHQFGSVRVTYKTGYGTTGASVPEALRTAILVLVAHHYENRENEVVGSITQSYGIGYLDLIAPYRLVRY